MGIQSACTHTRRQMASMKAFYVAFLLLLIAMSVNSWRRRYVVKHEKRDASKENGLARSIMAARANDEAKEAVADNAVEENAAAEFESEQPMNNDEVPDDYDDDKLSEEDSEDENEQMEDPKDLVDERHEYDEAT